MDGSLVIDLPALRATLAGALDACEAQLGTRVPVEIDIRSPPDGFHAVEQNSFAQKCSAHP